MNCKKILSLWFVFISLSLAKIQAQSIEYKKLEPILTNYALDKYDYGRSIVSLNDTALLVCISSQLTNRRPQINKTGLLELFYITKSVHRQIFLRLDSSVLNKDYEVYPNCLYCSNNILAVYFGNKLFLYRITNTNSEIDELKYIASGQIKDWRYYKSQSGIMTTLFLGKFIFGTCKPSDDIASLHWLNPSK